VLKIGQPLTSIHFYPFELFLSWFVEQPPVIVLHEEQSTARQSAFGPTPPATLNDKRKRARRGHDDNDAVTSDSEWEDTHGGARPANLNDKQKRKSQFQ